MDNKQRAILRLAESRDTADSNTPEGQRSYLERVIRIIPVLDAVRSTQAGKQLYDENTADVSEEMMKWILFTIDRLLSVTADENIVNAWTFHDTDALLDGLNALLFYAKAVPHANHIAPVCKQLLRHLQERIDDTVLQETVGQAKEKAVQRIRQAEQLFFLHRQNTDPRLPMLDPRGNVLLFTERDHAVKVAHADSEIPLDVIRFVRDEKEELMRFWNCIGIDRLRLNVCVDGETDLTVGECFAMEPVQYEGIRLHTVLLRLRQTAGVPSMSLTNRMMFRLATHILPEALFLVPVTYSDDPVADVEDRFVHVTQRAAERLMKKQIEKMIGMPPEDYLSAEQESETGEHPLVGQTVASFADQPVPFYGCENYAFAHAQGTQGVQLGKPMHIRTILNGGKAFLPLFTDMHALHGVFGEKVRVAIFTWDDVMKRLDDVSLNPNGGQTGLEGLVIDPNRMSLVFPVGMAKEIDSQKNQPPAQPPEQTPHQPPAPKTQAEQLRQRYSKVQPIAASEQKKTNYGDAALKLSVLALFVDFVCAVGLVTLLLGILACVRARREGDGKEVKKAIAAIVISVVGLVLHVPILLRIITDAM